MRIKIAVAVAILLCFSSDLLAQVTAPATVSGVGPVGGVVYSIVVDPSDSNTLYSVSEAGVFKSTDRGTTWSYSGLVGTGVSSITVVPQSPATVYAAAPGNIFKSLDAGATWNQAPGTPPNLALLGVDAQGTLFGRVRPPGGFFKSSDQGTTWQPAGVGLPTQAPLGPLAINQSTNTLSIAAVALPFTYVFRSTNGGASWSPIASLIPDAGPGLTIDPGNPNTMYLTTEVGFIKSTDGGKSWNSINNGLTNFAAIGLVIDPQNTATLYAAGTIRFNSGGAIFKSTNGGQNWTLISSFRAASLTIDPRDSNTLYASAFEGVTGDIYSSQYYGFSAFKSTDGGASWSEINTNLRATPVVSAVVDPQSPENLYVATFRYGVLKSTNKGQSWAPSSSGIPSKDAGGNYVSVVAMAIDPQTPNVLYAGTVGGGTECDSGGVLRSIDAGANWVAGKVIGDCIDALVVDPRIQSTIYVLTESSGVWKSIDGGGSLNPINTGLPKGSVTDLAIDPQNSQILYTAVGKTVYKSTDGGASWNYSSDLSAAVAQVTTDGQHPGTVYAIITPSAGGGIWKSVDGGTNWQDLSAALPALPNNIALDPKNSSTIYAATDFGVITSADGGKSWTLLTTAVGKGIQRLIPGTASTLYASGSGGLFAISSVTVTALTFDIVIVQPGGSYTATVAGSSLNDTTYFDVLVRAPGSTDDILVINWQIGISEIHSLPADVSAGTWTIDGVRAHQDPNDHTGSFAPVSATITVSP
jgi:photosystem II stability/assembly factor-like uncharacterized protein